MDFVTLRFIRDLEELGYAENVNELSEEEADDFWFNCLAVHRSKSGKVTAKLIGCTDCSFNPELEGRLFVVYGEDCDIY